MLVVAYRRRYDTSSTLGGAPSDDEMVLFDEDQSSCASDQDYSAQSVTLGVGNQSSIPMPFALPIP